MNLDAILSATSYVPARQRGSEPSIVSVNNDLSSINWVRGMSDPGEMIACGAYQELRRQDGENDQDYASRINVLLLNLPVEHREKILNAGRTAAIARAGLDVSNGKVNIMVAGESAWHGLGVNVAAAVSSEHAIRLAGLDWSVVKIPTGYEWKGEWRSSDDSFALVREDTGAKLSDCGSGYKPVQNAEAFAFMDDVLAEFGAKYDVAMSLHGGSKIALVVSLPKQSFTLPGRDENLAYATFMNPHVCGETAKCFPTSVRSVCSNTFNAAAKDAGKGIRIRHTGNIKAKIKDAQEALGIACRDFDTYRLGAEELVRKRLPSVRDYVNDVLDQTLPVSKADMVKGADAIVRDSWLAVGKEVASEHKQADMDREFKAMVKAMERRTEIVEDIMDRYESRTNGVAGMRGTAWAGFNAVTEHADHAKIGRQRGTEEKRASLRVESSLAGEGNDLKQAAYKLAMAY